MNEIIRGIVWIMGAVLITAIIGYVLFGLNFVESYTEIKLQEEIEEGCKIHIYPNNTVWCEIEETEVKYPERAYLCILLMIGALIFWAWLIMFRGAKRRSET